MAALLGAGKLSEAEAICTDVLATAPSLPPAVHLMGLIRAQRADAREAERLLGASIQLEPSNLKFRVNFANFLRRSGRLQEAEAHYRSVLELDTGQASARHSLALTLHDLRRETEAEMQVRTLLAAYPNDHEAWALLGLILDGQEKLLEAEAAYRRSLTLNPGYALAHHNLGAVLARMERAEESLAALDQAERLGGASFELSFNRGRTLVLLNRPEEAERAFADAVASRPLDLESQLNLARLRFMRGDAHFDRSLKEVGAAHPGDLRLLSQHAAVLWRAGRLDAAEARLRDGLARADAPPQLRGLLSQVLREAGRLQEAESEAFEAATALPNDGSVVENLISILLSRGRPEEALQFIRTQRARQPLAQGWIAYEATAERLLGRPPYRDLYDYARFVRLYRLEPPAGWSSIAELNAALLTALAERHRFVQHPLDQSLRHGSQTARNLVADPDSAIGAILQAFEAPIRAYMSELGRSAAHPFTARNRGAAQITGAWSVQLHRGGFHVNHYHGQGWISSAYYVGVPAEVGDTTLKSGWLKFGEPRFATPGATPALTVQPSAGLLVLFPSYMWHGTEAIHGPELRTTIAFDAVPLPAQAS